MPKGANAASGKGDSVVQLTDKITKAAVTNQGEANFVVEVVSDEGYDLAVNEIGSYQGTVPLRGPALVQVTSSGNWSIQSSR